VVGPTRWVHRAAPLAPCTGQTSSDALDRGAILQQPVAEILHVRPPQAAFMITVVPLPGSGHQRILGAVTLALVEWISAPRSRAERAPVLTVDLDVGAQRGERHEGACRRAGGRSRRRRAAARRPRRSAQAAGRPADRGSDAGAQLGVEPVPDTPPPTPVRCFAQPLHLDRRARRSARSSPPRRVCGHVLDRDDRP